jgi:hypothetical protein
LPWQAKEYELRTSGGGLDGYYLFHAARADLLRRLGRDEEAAAAYDAARALTANPVEQAFLDAQRTAVSGPPAALNPTCTYPTNNGYHPYLRVPAADLLISEQPKGPRGRRGP